MGPLIEGIVGLLTWLRRVGAVVILAFVCFIVWLALGRAGRRGLELAAILLAGALACFSLAVMAPRPPMSETFAVALAVLAALLLVATAGFILWYGVRRRKRPRVVEHTHPPWENGGW
jgi:O-antigen/teichoic acid export membrane protein